MIGPSNRLAGAHAQIETAFAFAAPRQATWAAL
jgi:hypothetical protein